MRRYHLSLAAVLLGTAGLLAYSAPGRAQGFAKSLDLYAGARADQTGIKLAGWGSGLAREDTGKGSLGSSSIEIKTNGYYAGGRILFQTPVEITDQKQDPYGFLEFIVYFQPGTLRARRNMGGPGGSGGPGGYPGGSGGYPGGGEADSGEGFAGGFSGGGLAGGAFGGTQQIAPDTRKLKVLLICEEGTFVASEFPVTLLPATSSEGWFSVAIPFVAFKGLDQASTARIKEIRIFGDTKDTFWIGEIRTTTDDEPITVDALENLEVALGDVIEFTATATGGISPLKYSWDFDASDGIQEDASGPSVVHVYRKASNDPRKDGNLEPYLVTLTVSDITGAKKPERRTMDVIVNP